MSQWAFVIAAYAVALSAVATMLGLSFRSMRRAEAESEQYPGRR